MTADLWPVPAASSQSSVPRRATRRGTAVSRWTVTGAIALAVLGSGAGNALAGYTATGTGQATAAIEVGTTVAVSASDWTGLHPGGPVAELQATIVNGGAEPYQITELVPSLQGQPVGCPQTLVSSRPPAVLPVVPVGATVVVEIPVTLSEAAPAACQGGSFEFTVVVEGQS